MDNPAPQFSKEATVEQHLDFEYCDTFVTLIPYPRRPIFGKVTKYHNSASFVTGL